MTWKCPHFNHCLSAEHCIARQRSEMAAGGMQNAMQNALGNTQLERAQAVGMLDVRAPLLAEVARLRAEIERLRDVIAVQDAQHAREQAEWANERRQAADEVERLRAENTRHADELESWRETSQGLSLHDVGQMKQEVERLQAKIADDALTIGAQKDTIARLRAENEALKHEIDPLALKAIPLIEILSERVRDQNAEIATMSELLAWQHKCLNHTRSAYANAARIPFGITEWERDNPKPEGGE